MASCALEAVLSVEDPVLKAVAVDVAIDRVILSFVEFKIPTWNETPVDIAPLSRVEPLYLVTSTIRLISDSSV